MQAVVPTQPAVIPAEAGIQYSRAPAINNGCRGVLGRPVKPGDDGGDWCSVIAITPSPSLPWRDDLDFVAAFQRRFGPAAFRQHVEIQRDGKMAAFIFEFAEQRVDTRRRYLPRLAIDDHAHCITS